MAKLLYTIGEVEKLLGETQSTIKFWEQQFPYLRRNHVPGKTRRYTQQDIEALRAIKSLLRDKGLKIEAAKEALKKKRSSLELRQNTITRLKSVLQRLENLKDVLQKQ